MTAGAHEDPQRELLRAMRRAARAAAERQIADETMLAEQRRAVVLPRLRRVVAALRGRGRVEKVWLFGSYAWGLPDERSDVDLLVQGSDDPFGLAGEVAAEVRLDVHVIERARAAPSLVARVDEEGMPL
jgi:predicted nucleotidyltransferase